MCGTLEAPQLSDMQNATPQAFLRAILWKNLVTQRGNPKAKTPNPPKPCGVINNGVLCLVVFLCFFWIFVWASWLLGFASRPSGFPASWFLRPPGFRLLGLSGFLASGLSGFLAFFLASWRFSPKPSCFFADSYVSSTCLQCKWGWCAPPQPPRFFKSIHAYGKKHFITMGLGHAQRPLC